MTFDERYDAKVDRSGGPDACWPWMAYTDPNGYGTIGRNGKMVRANRVALERELGRSIWPGQCSCHTCDNPPCCNPSHLFEGTRGDNQRDMVAKGRGVDTRGVQNNHAKLTDADVRGIRDKHRRGALQKEIAGEFGMDVSSISYIVNRKTWKHVEDVR